jgi:hypothetical protein
MQTPILGQSYVARSINAADNRMVNLFPEATPENGKTIGYLNRAPGLVLFATVGSGPIRIMDGRYLSLCSIRSDTVQSNICRRCY